MGPYVPDKILRAVAAYVHRRNLHPSTSQTAKEFKRDDIVFVLDRSIVEGTSQALRTKFNPSPYVVINPTFTTTVVRRIADGFQGSYSNNDLKLYKRFSPEFNNLPIEVAKILMHDYKDFISTDFSVIAAHDNLELPTSLELFVPDENYELLCNSL